MLRHKYALPTVYDNCAYVELLRIFSCGWRTGYFSDFERMLNIFIAYRNIVSSDTKYRLNRSSQQP